MSYFFWCWQSVAETKGPKPFLNFQFYHHGYRNEPLPRATHRSLSLGEVSFNSANLLSPGYVQNILLDAIVSAIQIWTLD